MKFPVLLGRKFLTRKFVVDINRTNLSYRHKQKMARKEQQTKNA